MREGVGQQLYEALVGAAVTVLENRFHGQVATRAGSLDRSRIPRQHGDRGGTAPECLLAGHSSESIGRNAGRDRCSRRLQRSDPHHRGRTPYFADGSWRSGSAGAERM
jgi:hypothetical protein